MSLLENIKNITYYYIKKEYKCNLKKNNIKYMKSKEIKTFSNSLFDNQKDEIHDYIKTNLKKIMKNELNEDAIDDVINDMIEDRDLVINRLVLEIEMYQKKRKKKKKKKSEK